MTDRTNHVSVTYTRGAALDQGTYDFDLLDRKGRRLGYQWSLQALTVAPYVKPTGNSYHGCWAQDPALIGERVLITCTATRDGKRFGASHGSHRYVCVDLEAARRKTVDLAEACRKRYARQPQDQR